jgi:hypothetical protein
VEESNFYSISTALWYSKPVAVHTAAPSKLYKKERKIEVSNPQVLPCPSFRGWLPSLEQYLPYMSTRQVLPLLQPRYRHSASLFPPLVDKGRWRYRTPTTSLPYSGVQSQLLSLEQHLPLKGAKRDLNPLITCFTNKCLDHFGFWRHMESRELESLTSSLQD